MSFLLDTNIASAHIRRPGGLAHRFIQHTGRLYLPSIALAELFAWAYGKDDPKELLEQIEELSKVLLVLDFDPACARIYGQLRGTLKRSGANVSPPDLMIASTALAHDLTVVTNNTVHFRPVPGLRLVDWLTS